MNPKCNMCGGDLVLVRGRYPSDTKREVCPVCLADRMDNIRDISDKNYGIGYQSKPT